MKCPFLCCEHFPAYLLPPMLALILSDIRSLRTIWRKIEKNKEIYICSYNMQQCKWQYTVQ